MRRAAAIVIAGLLSAVAGHAQGFCHDDETVKVCEARLEAQLESKMPASSAINSKVQAKPSTADSVDSAMRSGKKDFWPKIFAALQSAKLDSQKQELDLAYNFHRSFGDFQLQSVVHQPEVFRGLQDKLTTRGDSAKLSELKSSLNDLGDVSVGVSFNLENQYVGRRFENYRAIFEPLFANTLAQVSNSNNRAVEAIKKRHNLLRNEPLPASKDLDDIVMGSLSRSLRSEVEEAISEGAKAVVAFEVQETNTIEEAGLSAFANLKDNQPQFNVTASYRSRAHLVGPDEGTFQASYEYGFTSVNGYRRRLEKECNRDDAKCATDKLKEYAESLKAGNRLTITAEYHIIQSYSLNAATDGADISMSRANRKTISLDYGRRVLFDPEGNELARIELKGTYENFTDAPDHKDRLVVDFSFIQKVSDTFSFPIGISYANHSYFLGDVQKRFSAHFGLHAKIFNGS